MCPCTHHFTPTLWRLGTALLLSLAVGPVWATDSAAAAAAVSKLLALPVPGHETAVAASETGTRNTITVKSGETLDRVIRRAWPSLPFKDEFVRQAFVQINPGLSKASAYRALPAGTVLQVPGSEDFLALLAMQYPAMAKSHAAQHKVATEPPVPTKRRWVQFP